MNLRLLTIFIFSSACFLTSCKKSNNNSPNNPNKLKTYIEDARQTSLGTIDTINFSYDGNNRVISATSSNMVNTYYKYGANSFTLDLYVSGLLSIHEIFYVNGSVVDSTFQYNDTNDTTTEGYSYNGNLLTRLSSYDYSTLTGSQINQQDDYTYDNNGNLIKDVQSDGYGNINMSTTYTYTNNVMNFSLSPTYIPKQSNNLPATQTQTDGNGNHIVTITYSYVFDSSNRVTKETDTADDGEVVVKSYIYF